MICCLMSQLSHTLWKDNSKSLSCKGALSQKISKSTQNLITQSKLTTKPDYTEQTHSGGLSREAEEMIPAYRLRDVLVPFGAFGPFLLSFGVF